MNFLVVFLILLPFIAQAQINTSCPWSMGSSLKLSKEKDKKVYLNADQVKEDLECLKLLIESHYVAKNHYPENVIPLRIKQMISASQSIYNTDLIEKIFKLHENIYDLHLGYNLLGSDFQFESTSKKLVKLKPELESERVYEIKDYVYFKPGDLYGELTAAQDNFIQFVHDHDKNLVLDLRQNGGGDDIFAFRLAEALFTPSQKIPQAKTTQVTSHLTNIGLCNAINLLGYRGYEEYCRSTYQSINGLSFDDVIQFGNEEEIEQKTGTRKSPFNSKIILIIDSGCASSCETIVEKLSAHPRARVIGQNTAGALHFSNPIMFQLPHSGILVRIPTLLHSYENDAPEGVGYTPDEKMDYIQLDNLNLKD